MACSLPGSSVHEILQARMLEWVAISFFKGSSQSRDRTQVFCIEGRFLTIWATGEALFSISSSLYFSGETLVLTILHGFDAFSVVL